MSVAAQDMRDDLNWSEADKGLVLSAFYWGYALGQIPSSILVKRYGAKWIFGLSVLIPSFLTLLVPVACRHSLGLALFIRAIIGFFESASFPAVFHFFPIWVPLKEKTLMIPAIVSGMYMGEIIGFSASGVLVRTEFLIHGVSYGRWALVFYVFGLMGILWFPYWAMFAYESPQTHPKITRQELDLMITGKSTVIVKDFRRGGTGTEADNKTVYNVIGSEQLLSPGTREGVYMYDMQSPVIAGANPMPARTISMGTDGIGPVFLSMDPSPGDESSATADEEEDMSTVLLNPATGTGTGHRVAGSNGLLYEQIMQSEVDIDEPTRDSMPRSSRVPSICTEDGSEMVKRTPWVAFFTHPVALTLYLNSWSFGFIGFTLLSEMPAFFEDVLGFDLQSSGILCVFPYLMLFISALGFGILFQYMQSKYGWSTDLVRQVAEYVAFLGCAGGLCLVGFIDNKYGAYAMIVMTQLLFGSVQAGLGCAYSDVAPNYSSALNSCGNTISAIGGIVGPLVVASMVEKYGIWGWRAVFFLITFMGAVALFFWSRYMTSSPVPALNNPVPLRRR